MNAEDIGNINYGATGSAMNFSEELLKWAGATPNIKDNIFNLFKPYFGDSNRDLVYIKYGIDLYNYYNYPITIPLNAA